MTVMVDDLVIYSNAWGPFLKGSCHLTTYGPLEELHAFARRIGMKRSWYQDHPLMAHYDLTPRRRAKALNEGAACVSGRDQTRVRRAARRLVPLFREKVLPVCGPGEGMPPGEWWDCLRVFEPVTDDLASAVLQLFEREGALVWTGGEYFRPAFVLAART